MSEHNFSSMRKIVDHQPDCFLPQVSHRPIEMKRAPASGPKFYFLECNALSSYLVCGWSCILKWNSSIPTLLSYSPNLEWSYLVIHEPSCGLR